MRTLDNLFETDDRGVSPVIGVILMVAITVILAAVIGTFVLGLGQNVSQTTPQASLSMQDTSADFDPSATTGQDMMTISHNGGDALVAGDLRIVLKDSSGATVDSLEYQGSTAGFANSGDTIGVFYTDGGTQTLITKESRELQVGGSWTIAEKSSSDASGLSDETTYTVQVIHKPSSRPLYETTVTLR